MQYKGLILSSGILKFVREKASMVSENEGYCLNIQLWEQQKYYLHCNYPTCACHPIFPARLKPATGTVTNTCLVDMLIHIFKKCSINWYLIDKILGENEEDTIECPIFLKEMFNKENAKLSFYDFAKTFLPSFSPLLL